MVITQNLIPIALYASVEVIKAAQAYLIGQDRDMYYEKLDSKCVPRTWNLSDDLGQVSYLFSDKTGTLTENVMKFKRCTINGKSYGNAESNREENWADTLKILEASFGPNKYADQNFEFLGRSLAEALCHGSEVDKKCITDFFTLIALCHTVFIDRSDSAGSFPFSSLFRPPFPLIFPQSFFVCVQQLLPRDWFTLLNLLMRSGCLKWPRTLDLFSWSARQNL